MSIVNASSEAMLENGLGGDIPPANGPAGDTPPTDEDFLKQAQNAYRESTDFLTGFVQKHWARDIDHFQSKHASGSRYLADEYRSRSRLFRPKTRSMVRRSEADCARAFFSTQDVVNVAPVDDSVEKERAGAEITGAILQYRLTKKIPWFRIVQGQYQTANVMGVCCSKQYWAFEEKVTKTGRWVPVLDPYTGEQRLDDVTGAPAMMEEETRKIVRDDLVIQPIPPENMRIHPGADWLNPIQLSPYLIYRFPMYVAQVRERSKLKDPKTGQPTWREVSPQAVAGALVDETLGLREKREGGQDRFSDQAAASPSDNEMALVWVHENIIRRDGEDWQFYTLGTQQILSDPRPLKEVYFLDERPFTWGVGQIEAFRLFPESKVGLVFDLQVRANHLENLRLDNVFQALEPKVLVKSASNIDLRALTSSRVGGVVQVPGNPNDVVSFVRPPDVTASSYQEQNMLNLDFDDLAGQFSGSSVQSNRDLNETVGGMNLLAGGANTLGEYDLRIFAETWVEPTLTQAVKLVQRYETDLTVIALAGKQAQTWQRYNIDPMTDDLLSAELTTTVNVGIGATNPEQRLGRFMGALGSVLKIGEPLVKVYGPQVVESPGFEAITKEVFGLAGYKDGKRFLDFKLQESGLPPEVQQQMQAMQEQIAQLEQKLASNQEKIQGEIAKTEIQEAGETERTGMEIASRERISAQDRAAQVRQHLGGLIAEFNQPERAAA